MRNVRNGKRDCGEEYIFSKLNINSRNLEKIFVEVRKSERRH